MIRSFGPIKTAVAAAGFLFVAMDCDSRTRGTAPPPRAMEPAPQPVVPLPTVPPLPADTRTEDERNTIQVFRSVQGSTVFVTEKQILVDYYSGQYEEQQGSGSGFVWDTAGHIVTNFHVVKDAHALAVTLYDHRSYQAAVVGVEPKKDIAVLQISAPKESLRPIELLDKNRRVEVGQKAIAIGNPFGLDQTLTTGVVSALGRIVQGIGGVSIRDMVQTDAAINPGNSGGPLLDSSGRLIGMNTMIYSRSGSSAGIGFAVPVKTIARVVPQIIRTGHAEQVGIGIHPAQDPNVRGVIVVGVLPGSPAEKAGIIGVQSSFARETLGDVIVAVNGQPIDDFDDLYNALDQHQPGENVTITLVQNGKTRTVSVALEVVR